MSSTPKLRIILCGVREFRTSLVVSTHAGEHMGGRKLCPIILEYAGIGLESNNDIVGKLNCGAWYGVTPVVTIRLQKCGHFLKN